MDSLWHVVTSQAFDEDQKACVMQHLFFMREILVLYLRLDKHDLKMTIHLEAFHLRRKSKINRQIE